jgi:hypothetical protein
MRDLSLRELAHRWWRPAVVVLVVLAAVAWRLLKDQLGAPPNLELSTAAAFVAAALLRNRVAALAPLAVVAASDLLLGNTSILAFTWSAWAVIGLASLLTRRVGSGWRRYLAAAGFGVGGTALFFLWTNFGVWALGAETYYPGGWDGLSASFVAGLPFLRPQLLGNLVLVPLAAALVALVERLERARTTATAGAVPTR